MWTVPNIVSNCLQHAYSFFLIIPDFLIRFTLLTILGNAHRPCKQYTNIVDNGLHRISLFFSDFFWFSGYIYLNYHIRKCAQTIKLYLNIINNFRSCLSFFSSFFFLIFSLYLAIFTLITISGNLHRPCKLYLNIINNFTSCLSFFSWFFSWFSHCIYITYHIRKCGQTMFAFIVTSQ